LLPIASAQSAVLVDNFDGSSIDASTWAVSTPFPASSVTASAGNAEFRSRGRLLSVADLPASVEITGRVKFLGGRDALHIVTRTDGVTTNPHGEFDTGLRFVIFSDGEISRVEISPVRNWVSIAYAAAYAPVPQGVWLDFKLVDTGSEAMIFFGDMNSPKLTLGVPDVLGSKLGVFNIESIGSHALLDYISVSEYTPPCVPTCEDLEALTFRVETLESIVEDLAGLVDELGSDFESHEHDKGSKGRHTSKPTKREKDRER